MHQNLRWWLPYRFLTGLHFWYPIFFLYFLARLPLVQVLGLRPFVSVGGLLEVPAVGSAIAWSPSHASDFKAAHVVSALLLPLSEGDFVLLATAQLFLTAGFAFTMHRAAFLHDTLQSSAGDRYERLGAIGRLGFWLRLRRHSGGVCWVVEPRLAYIFTAISSLAAFVLLLKMVEPPRSKGPPHRGSS